MKKPAMSQDDPSADHSAGLPLDTGELVREAMSWSAGLPQEGHARSHAIADGAPERPSPAGGALADPYEAEQRRLGSTPSPVPDTPRGIVVQVAVSERAQQSLVRTRANLQHAIQMLRQPQLPPSVEKNLQRLFPYGLTPEVKDGLMQNFQDTLDAVSGAINGETRVRYVQSFPKDPDITDIAAATADPAMGDIAINVDRFSNPRYAPLSDLQFDRTLLHEFSHTGARTVDNWYLYNDGNMAWGFIKGHPGRFSPQSYQAPYLANADTNAVAVLMLNWRFPLF